MLLSIREILQDILIKGEKKGRGKMVDYYTEYLQ
jgi:hypothetical protein